MMSKYIKILAQFNLVTLSGCIKIQSNGNWQKSLTIV